MEVEAAHFVLVPLVAQGHMIPMVDLARLLADRGARVSLITTPVNAARIRPVIDAIKQSALPIDFVELPFPGPMVGVPAGCENADLIADRQHIKVFFEGALPLLAGPLEAHILSLPRRPDCVVFDNCNPWAAGVARRLGIPRVVFHGPSCFFLLAVDRVNAHKVHDRVAGEYEPFEVPDFPARITMNKVTTLGFFQWPGWEDKRRQVLEEEASADGVIMNTFDDLERDFIASYETAAKKKVWTVGPLCLLSGNRDPAMAAARGNQAAIDRDSVVSWLDARGEGSVFYVSFGSMARSRPKQLIEIGCGLEASKRPFVWVVKDIEMADEAVREWFAEGFEERVRDRGLVIRGWAPQMVIMAHPAVGAFVTHCGWNSTLEAVCHGLPMATWPHFADQFLNEALAVHVLRVGVSVGVKVPTTHLSEDGDGVQVRREELVAVIEALMEATVEGRERRERAKALAEKARQAMEEGGSSYENTTDMIRFVLEKTSKTKTKQEALV